MPSATRRGPRIPSLATAAGRAQEHDRIDAHLQEWCRARSADDIVACLWDAGVPVGKVMQPHRQPDLAQLEFRNFFEEVDHPVIGRSRYSTLPIRFSRGPERLHVRHAPLLGEHNAELLAELGLDEPEIDALEAAGIIGCALAPESAGAVMGERPPFEPAPFDVVEASRRVWLEQWSPEAASGMAVFTAILRSYQMLTDEVNRVMSHHDLTFARYEVLTWLATDPESSLTLSWISKTLRIPPATVTNIIDRLEADELVRRVPHPSDARTTLAVITARGRRVAADATSDLNVDRVRTRSVSPSGDGPSSSPSSPSCERAGTSSMWRARPRSSRS